MADQRSGWANTLLAVWGVSPFILLGLLLFAPILALAGVFAIGHAVGGNYTLGMRGTLLVFGGLLIAAGFIGFALRPIGS
jgi:hypothetical protein